MNNKRGLKYFFLFFLVISMLSCVKEKFDTDLLNGSLEFKPSFAAPIGYLTLDLSKYLQDSLGPIELNEDAEGFLTLIYNQHLYSLKASDYFYFSTIDYSYSYTNETGIDLDLSSIPSPITFTDTITFDFSLSGGNERIDSIMLNSATFNISTESNYTINGGISFVFPGITLNNNTYAKTISYGSTYQYTDLSGYTIRLINDQSGSNQLVLEFTITLQNSNAIIPPGGTIVDIDIEFSDVRYGSIFGYFGQESIDIAEQTLNLNIYDNITDGDFHFENPEVKINMNNSFGIPIEITLTDFEALTRDNGTVSITGSNIPDQQNPFTINYPSISIVGETYSDSIYINVSNTNLFDVLEDAPLELSFGVSGALNPQGSAHYNFMTDSSQFDVDVKFTLPIWGSADFLIMQDTLAFDFLDFYEDNPDEIKKLTFRLNFTNGFPVNLNSQIYFTDENYSVLDSLFTDHKVVSAGEDTNNNGKVNPVQNEPLNVVFTSDKIDNIRNSKYIIIWGQVNTTNSDQVPPEPVKFFSDYFLKVYLGVIVDLEINTGDY